MLQILPLPWIGELTAESPFPGFPVTVEVEVPLFPVVDALTPEFTLPEPPVFAPRPVVEVLVEAPRAQTPSWGDFLIPT